MGAWAAVSAAVQASGVLPPPPLKETLWAEVAQGKIARQRENTAASDKAMGVAVFPSSQAALWLSITADTTTPASGVTEVRLEGSWASSKLLYQRLDLPWPIQDRHWAIRLQNNTALAKASGVWERFWKLDSAALSRARSVVGEVAWLADGGALETPVNEGSWLLVPLDPGNTLVIYQTRASLGGTVPDNAVESWAWSSISEVMLGYAKEARTINSRYGPGCSPQPGGDGVPIPCFP
jgi:hypothetical protein